MRRTMVEVRRSKVKADSSKASEVPVCRARQSIEY